MEVKKISISGVEYDIKSNALTRFHYKKLFKKGIFEDISELNKFNNKQEQIRKKLKAEENLSDEEIETKINEETMADLDNLLDAILQMTYVLIYTANPNCLSYEKWLDSMDSVNLKEDWVSEVITTISTTFC